MTSLYLLDTDRCAFIFPRALVKRDVDQAIKHYLDQHAESAAPGFIDALVQAYVYISRHAATGPPRYAHALNLPGLRCWALARHAHLVFCIEMDVHIDVWRVLHGGRHMPAWMRHPDQP